MAPLELRNKHFEKERIVCEVIEFYTEHKSPIPLQAITAKFYVILQQCGGWYNIMNELYLEKKLKKTRIKTGRTFLLPGEGAF